MEVQGEAQGGGVESVIEADRYTHTPPLSPRLDLGLVWIGTGDHRGQCSIPNKERRPRLTGTVSISVGRR